MKFRILTILIFIFISKNCFAETRYLDLLELNSTNNTKDTIKLIDQLTMAFDLENAFINSCLIALEITRKKSSDDCKKVLDRTPSTVRLFEIISSQKFKTNLTNLANKIDQKEINSISGNKLEKKLKILFKEYEQLNESIVKINFYMDNL